MLKKIPFNFYGYAHDVCTNGRICVKEIMRGIFHCVRPWVSGAPLRIAMFERVLDHALALGQVWTPTAGEVVAAWRAATRVNAGLTEPP